jgi:hypothetical protein
MKPVAMTIENKSVAVPLRVAKPAGSRREDHPSVAVRRWTRHLDEEFETRAVIG